MNTQKLLTGVTYCKFLLVFLNKLNNLTYLLVNWFFFKIILKKNQFILTKSDLLKAITVFTICPLDALRHFFPIHLLS